MDSSLKILFLEHLLIGLSLGLFVWFFTWGMNRVYLQVKAFFN